MRSMEHAAAIKHVEDFRGSNWETRFGGLFSIENFAVLGNSSQELKDSLMATQQILGL